MGSMPCWVLPKTPQADGSNVEDTFDIVRDVTITRTFTSCFTSLLGHVSLPAQWSCGRVLPCDWKVLGSIPHFKSQGNFGMTGQALPKTVEIVSIVSLLGNQYSGLDFRD